MKNEAFTTSSIARIVHHSRETVKRWLERGEIKGYRVGTSGHWRVLPKDLAFFLKRHSIPFPEPEEIGIDLKALADIRDQTTFCWEFFRGRLKQHACPDASCNNCLVFKVKSINCYALREEVGHRQIHCAYACEDCAYLRFQQTEIFPEL